MVKQLRAANPNSLVVDTGDTIVGSGSSADILNDGLLVRTLSQLHYDALNAGTGELLAGPSALRELAGGSPPLVSANGALSSSDTTPSLVKPYVVKEVAGHKVALVGVTDGGTGDYGSIKPAQSPVDALRSLLPDVRSKADVVVVLADVNESSIRDIAEAGLGIDVLLGARSTAGREPTLIGKTLVANAGGLGRYVDRLTLTLNPDGRVGSFSHEEVAVDDSIPDDQGVAQLRATYKG